MKKYLLGLFAVVLAVGFSAFTVVAPKQTVRYAVHNGTTFSTEKTFTSYTLQAAVPAACPGVNTITCWFQLTDLNADNVIDQDDFNIRVAALDVDSDGRISDDQGESAGIYLEKP